MAFVAAHGYKRQITSFLFQLLFVSLYREAVAFIAAHGYTIHITSLFILIVVLVVVQGGRGVYCGAWVHGTLNT